MLNIRLKLGGMKMVWTCDADEKERVPKKILNSKWRKYDREEHRSRWIDQIRKDIEMRGENWE